MIPLWPVAAVQHHEISARYAGIRFVMGRTIQQGAPHTFALLRQRLAGPHVLRLNPGRRGLTIDDDHAFAADHDFIQLGIEIRRRLVCGGFARRGERIRAQIDQYVADTKTQIAI